MCSSVVSCVSAHVARSFKKFCQSTVSQVSKAKTEEKKIVIAHSVFPDRHEFHTLPAAKESSISAKLLQVSSSFALGAVNFQFLRCDHLPLPSKENTIKAMQCGV